MLLMYSIGKYVIMAVIAFLTVLYSNFIESEYLKTFFIPNSILLAGTIFTIHATGVGILIGQLDYIAQENNINLKRTIQSVRNSFIEAIILLFVILVCAISIPIPKKLLVYSACFPHLESFFIVISLTSIIAMFYIILDLSQALLACFAQRHT